jgi:nucleoporin SEH1
MLVCTALQADHEDLIHDVAYDFYGKRMATCSSDQTVKVS